jgi:ABC-type uncharacterized transport system substrate-binding protein
MRWLQAGSRPLLTRALLVALAGGSSHRVISRRTFVVALGAVLASPLAADAQQAGKVPRIGILSASYPSPPSESTWRGFYEGLRDLGWTVGRDLVVERRYAEGRLDRLRALAQDLIRLNVDVIVTFGPNTIKPAREATRTIPIVMIAGSGDPVRDGLVASLARPGGNVTGVASQAGAELIGKNLEILKEVFPRLSRVTILTDGPGSPIGDRAWEDATRRLGVSLERSVIQDPTELEPTMAAISRQRPEAVFVRMGGILYTSRNHLAALALARRLPTFATLRELPEAGGLLSYGPSIGAIYRRGAYYVDKILKGAKPADLPVELPTKFELVINLKTAKVLGLTVPQSVLMRADEVIQ